MSASIDYYENVFGFHLDFAWPDENEPRWAAVSRGNVRFILTIDLGTSREPFLAEKGNGVVFYILVDDIEAMYEQMDAKGAIFAQDMVEFGGRRQFSVGDPNGYVITFSEPFEG